MAALLFLVLVAIARVATTYPVFNHTYDEPFHLLRGLLWLTGQPYSHVEHPPLAEIACALGPYLDGARVQGTGDKIHDGAELLYGEGRYIRTLTLSRLGNLLFLVVAIAGVWCWGEREAECWNAVVAVMLFTNLPPVLAHAGLATSDLAITALFLWFILSLTQWLQERTSLRALRLGVVTGLSLLAKFSAILFLPFAVMVVVTLYFAGSGRWPTTRLRLRVLDLLAVGVLASSVIWLGYRGSMGALLPLAKHPSFKEFRGGPETNDPVIASVERRLSSLVLPAPEFVEGTLWLVRKAEQGHAWYFLGKPRDNRGSWLFFPVVLGVKTPLPFLLLFAVGALVVLSKRSPEGRWRRCVPMAVTVGLLGVVLPSSINLGVRHVLPLYPLLSLTAAYGVSELWHLRTAWLGRSAAGGLLLWLVVNSALAHPDYLSYFNALARRHPETIVVDSDLDWGQDLNRLSAELRRRRIERVNIAYFGTARLEHHGLPEFQRLQPHQRTTGWIAISLTLLQTREGFYWLNRYEPVATIGDSMRLYHLHE